MSDAVWTARQSGWVPKSDDARTPYDVDYARIVHSHAFRRLQGKTQILNLGDSDFYRTRLTHTLEVAQIASGITRQFRAFFKDHPAYDYIPEESLVKTISYCHDIGHPPFGHGGEVALNYCMRDAGGYEGNGQTLRIVSKLEKMSEKHGADLTRRALLGMMKYPVAFSKVHNPELSPRLNPNTSTVSLIDRKRSAPPKCFMDGEQEIVDWALAPLSERDRSLFCSFTRKDGKHGKSRFKSWDCSIMDLADDIAYGVHDFEDAIALGLVREEQFREDISADVCAAFLDDLIESNPEKYSGNAYEQMIGGLFGNANRRKQFIGKLVHFFIVAVQIKAQEAFSEPLLKYKAVLPEGHAQVLDALKDFVFERVIQAPNVQHLEFKGQTMVVAVFETLMSEPKAFLPEDVYADFVEAEAGSRIVCDYVASMTDMMLLKTYDRLFSPRMGSIFDRV
ncbi:Deoxyguanosinetriphosphate triphosphohydrolase [Pseudovibrio sp. Ad46]|uniref:anti-phage deoxyguanosine triphosphatase n=1 Tax=Pseudovibrio sp. Ad46 TaxID=989432 RepID=UPI0007AEDD3D|nr:anti-phage deoxyguanosine triphosphatase [Pseudovibrio sp. Ad46]KZK91561.1 Deoxyguanosinetriphosphate triphosphohydrolase [Pseudovibrio sp. Ad46]